MRKDGGWGNYMTYCGMECCKDCSKLPKCGGCEKCNGHPFGGSCIAERNREFGKLKQQLITEINALGIHGLQVEELYLLSGTYVNLAYPLANGYSVKFLKDQDIYLGNQVERPGSERCYGVVAEETSSPRLRVWAPWRTPGTRDVQAQGIGGVSAVWRIPVSAQGIVEGSEEPGGIKPL